MEITAELKTAVLSEGTANLRQAEAANTTDISGTAADSAHIKTDAAPAIQSQQARLTEILQIYGFKATERNIAMLALMMENGLPLTQENVVKMNQAVKLTDSPEKALFLLLNGIRLTQANAEQLNLLADGRVRIADQLSSLLNVLSKMPDSPVKDTLLRLFSMVKNADVSLGAAAAQPGVPAGTGAAASAGQNTAGLPTAENASATPGTAGTPAAAAGTGAPNSISVPVVETAPAANASGTAISSVVPDSSAASAAPTANNPASNNSAQSSANETPPAASAATPPGGTAPAAAVPQKTTGAHVTEGEKTHAQTTERQASTNAEPSAGKVSPLPAGQAGEIPHKGQSARPARAAAFSAAVETELPGAAKQVQRQAEGKDLRGQTGTPRLSYRLLDSTPEDINRFVNSLRDALTQTRQALTEQRANWPETEQTLRQVQNLADQLDFMAQIKNQLFVQLPIFHNGQETPAALHIYKDGSSHKKSSDSTQSALIALDTASMGRFETYVQKRAHSVSCQFRLRDKAVEQLVRAHIHKLNSLLGEYHYSLDSFSFLPAGEAFSVLDSPSSWEGDSSEDSSSELLFVFDKRA